MMNNTLPIMDKKEFNKSILKGQTIFNKIIFKEDIRQTLNEKNIPFLFTITTKTAPTNFFTLSDGLIFTECTFNFSFSYTFLNKNTFIRCIFEKFEMNNMTTYNTDFIDCSIIEKDMNNSIFIKTSFIGNDVSCLLSKSIIHNSDFTNVTFGGANLERVDFSNCFFEYSRFIDCDLDRSNFNLSEFDDTSFSRCLMSNINLLGTNLRHLPLELNSRNINGGSEIFDRTIAVLSRFNLENLRDDQIRLINTFWNMNLATGENLEIEDLKLPYKPKLISKEKIDFDKINLSNFDIINGEIFLKNKPIKVKNVLKSIKFIMDIHYSDCKEDDDDLKLKDNSNIFKLIQSLLTFVEEYYKPTNKKK